MSTSKSYPWIGIAVLTALGVVGVFFFMNAGNKRERANADKSVRAELIKASQDQELQKFSLTGFDDQGKKFWNLEGDTAKVDPEQTVFLDENVTLKLRDDTIIKTDHVEWSQDHGLLRTERPVTVYHQNVIVHGTGAVGRPNESFVQLNRDIDMVINDKTHLTCRGPMKVYYKDNKMVFYRDVKVVDGKGTLTSKRMDVLFDPVEKKAEKIIAVGDVVIVRDSDTTRSRRAVYTLSTGSIRLEGNPEVTLHKNSKAIDAPFRS